MTFSHSEHPCEMTMSYGTDEVNAIFKDCGVCGELDKAST